MKLLDVKVCQDSEAYHLLLKQEHENFKYCPFCGEVLGDE